MTLTIETPEDVQEKIARVAARHGLSPEAYVLRAAIEKAQAEENDSAPAAPPSYPPGTTYGGVPVANFPILALFKQWEDEDPITGPEDLAQRQREGDEFMDGLRANRFNIPRDPTLVAIIEEMTEDDRQATGVETKKSNGSEP